ncbi:MAG: isoprenylcysteine carboxylmethyltransferase family protein [Acidimicrobiales bacterium]|nr:isoprenylcysteine carboxylmethyltransferase family protein [Acidimicrobiales bacterium]
MNEKQTGWAFVAMQVALLALVIFLPTGTDWERTPSVQAVGLFLNVAGLALLALGALGLGRSLTPTPVPVESGELKTTGLYSRMRHPIYSGVILLAIGIAGASGSILRVLATLALIGFFYLKARWEEDRLVKKFGREYEAYAARVNRFLPTPNAKIKAANSAAKQKATEEPDLPTATKRGYTEGKGRPTPKRPPKKRKR